jgi:hypothetical protein
VLAPGRGARFAVFRAGDPVLVHGGMPAFVETNRLGNATRRGLAILAPKDCLSDAATPGGS